MSQQEIHSVAIYPAIGIARVGNSPDEFFVGPTVPGQPAVDLDDHDFRDPEGRIKRQAAKFKVFGLDKQGHVLCELTEKDRVKIEWRVEIANKKAAWYNFDIALDIPAADGTYNVDGVKTTPKGLPVLSQRRNQGFEGARELLMIEPSAKTISGKNQHGPAYRFDDGKINHQPVYLGELRTDEEGNLLFLGGHGKSESFTTPKVELQTFANNNGWHDDTSDGSVDATVTLEDGRTLTAQGSWVVTAPPNFAQGVTAFVTGYDLLRDVAAREHASQNPEKPEFFRDIYPTLKSLTHNQWVNAGIQRDFGWGSPQDFESAALIERCASTGDKARPFRQAIFDSFRDPNYKTIETQAWPPLYGDGVTMTGSADDPRTWYAVTELQYRHLRQWAKGEFTVNPPSRGGDQRSRTAAEQAEGMTVAALEETLGGPFHPGCEFTWPMRHALMYNQNVPFRIKRRAQAKDDYGIAMSQSIALAEGGPLDGSRPGDITRWMAVPWQSDTSSCLSGYNPYSGEYLPTFWPARVPNDVLTEAQFNIISDPKVNVEARIEAFSPAQRKKWLRGYIYKRDGEYKYGSSIEDRIKGVTRFTKEWGKIGIIVRKPLDPEDDQFPKFVWVETGRQKLCDSSADAPAQASESAQVQADSSWFYANPRTLR